MKFPGIILLLALSIQSFSQKIEKYYNNLQLECIPSKASFYSVIVRTDTGFHRDVYFFNTMSLQTSCTYRDSLCKYPNGYYQSFYSNRRLNSKGRYVDGKKEGLWMGYHFTGMISDSIVYSPNSPVGTGLSWHSNGYLKDSTVLNSNGTKVRVEWFDNGSPATAGIFINDKKQGKWKYYHKNGQMSAIETYKAGNLFDVKYFDEEGAPQPGKTFIDRFAWYPGGLEKFKRDGEKNLFFPNKFEIENNTEALVEVSFTVNEDGKLDDIYISIPFHPLFDKIALAAVTKSSEWIPAASHNRKIKQTFTVPISYIQPDY